MDDQSLKNVLAIYRLLATRSSGEAVVTFIDSLAPGDITTSTHLRIAAYICDQANQARVIICSSNLSEEAKAGVVSGIDLMLQTFAIPNMNAGLGQIVASAPGHISSLVILLSATGSDGPTPVPEDAVNLAADVDELSKQFDDKELDPAVREVAKKHLAILATLIRHIPIFGLEAAMLTYFELITRLRRADSQSSPQSKGRLDPLFKTIKKWGQRLGDIDEVINKGANLIERADGARGLLEYLPDLSDVV